MSKHKFMKKLSITIASLALICPLALNIHQPVNASHVHKSQSISFINKRIHHDKRILNSKRGRYYINLYKDLNKQEIQLAHHFIKQRDKSIFTPVYKNGKPKSHRILSLRSIVNYKKDSVYDGYVRTNKRTKIYKLHFGKYGYLDKIIGSKWIKKGRIIHVNPLNHGIVITDNGFPKNYENSSYEWIL